MSDAAWVATARLAAVFGVDPDAVPIEANSWAVVLSTARRVHVAGARLIESIPRLYLPLPPPDDPAGYPDLDYVRGLMNISTGVAAPTASPPADVALYRPHSLVGTMALEPGGSHGPYYFWLECVLRSGVMVLICVVVVPFVVTIIVVFTRRSRARRVKGTVSNRLLQTCLLLTMSTGVGDVHGGIRRDRD